MDPIAKDGFTINGKITQSASGADWKITCYTALTDAGVVDDPDETAYYSLTQTVPFNEAPSESAITARLQATVDNVFDNEIPVPTP